MSAVAVSRNTAVAAAAVHLPQDGCEWMPPDPMEEMVKAAEQEAKDKERIDIWSSIQKEMENSAAAAAQPSSYVYQPVRRSSIPMSQKSLETCTEGLGSETGSDGFSSGSELDGYFAPFSSAGETLEEAEEEEDEVEAEAAEEEKQKKELPAVNYHCSIGRRSPAKSFPPPLPSISRRDGLCLNMKPHRRNGRLVVEAVKVPSQNYLHAERHGGRLLLSFIDTCYRPTPPAPAIEQAVDLVKEEDDAAEEEDVVEDEEEEEVEVVDRGTVVEVKVSTQPPPVSGAAAVKIHRSSLVINKFVVREQLPDPDEQLPPNPQPPGTVLARRPTQSTTTAAAAAVVASSISTSTTTSDGFHYNYLNRNYHNRWGAQSPAEAAAADAKLLFTSRRRSWEELMHDMWRCNELRRPLFIFERPYCIATSS